MSEAASACDDRDIGVGDIGVGDIGVGDIGVGDIGVGDIGVGDQTLASNGITFLIISTPVPPMPLIIMRENQGDNHYSNSYDLLQRVMRESHIKSEEMSKEEKESIKDRKMAAYQTMWEEIKNIENGSEDYKDPPCDWTISAIVQAYGIFQKYFRSMIQIYTSADAPLDIRFMPIDHLTPNDPIVMKTRDHLMALTQVWDAFDSGNHIPMSAGRMIYDRQALNYLPYYQLVGMYAHKIRINE